MKLINKLFVGLTLVAFISSCGANDDLKNFELISLSDSLSYAIGVAASDDLNKAKMPTLNPSEVRVGATDFLDSNLQYDLKVCYDVYNSIERQISSGELGILTTKKDVLQAKSDSLSYAVGAMICANHRRLDMGPVNPLAVQAGMQDYIDSTYRIEKAKCISMYQEAATVSQQRKRQAQMATMQKAAEEFLPNKAAGEKYLEDNLSKPGIKVTETGLQYRVISEGTGAKPQPSNTVKVHYTGKTITGEVFDSSVERGEPITFGVTGVIRGWTEGLMLMSVGAKYEFFIPQELAYGIQQRSELITPYSALYFEVELLEIGEAPKQ
jgi:FKBP-type peptidyl-prolyl cis-trans isomerase